MLVSGGKGGDMYRIKHLLGALLAVGLLAACGSEEPADGDAAASTDEGDDSGSDAGADDSTDDSTGDSTGDDGSDQTSDDTTGDDDGDTIVIDDFDDIPDECVDLMADFLREIEPSVSGIDWENVTIDELTAMGEGIGAPTDDFDRRSEEIGCDRYDIGIDDDQSLEFVLQVAEREAPGTVGWLQFIADMATAGNAVDDVTSGDGGDGDDAEAPPADCDGMKQYLLDRAEEYGSINDMPVAEVGALSTAISSLAQVCTVAEIEALYTDPVIQDFLGG